MPDPTTAAASAATPARPRRDSPAQPRPIRILSFTTLFPSAARPRHGIFVATRLRHLLRTGQVTAEVVAPVPWFPFPSTRFGEYGRIARTPAEESDPDFRVWHPRYPVLPVVGMSLQPAGLAWAARRAIERLIAAGRDFDLIDAHYLYPDGVAAARLAREFGKPLVLTARGSDVNVIAELRGPGRAILDATRQADAVITVSAALKRGLATLGVPETDVSVVRNGVDLDLFRPTPRDEARARLGLPPGPLVASVGNLVPLKGHDIVLRAIALLPAARAVIVGRGPEEAKLHALAQTLGLHERVRFLGEMRQSELCDLYAAADALVLASSSEGWPNVLLEALACGTPVVATDVGGVREIVTSEAVGRVVGERAAGPFAAAIGSVLAAQLARAQLRRHAESYSWGAVSEALVRLFEGVLGRRNAARGNPSASWRPAS